MLCLCRLQLSSLVTVCAGLGKALSVPHGASSLTILLPLQASFILTHRLGREFNFIHYVRESMDDDFSKSVCLLVVYGRDMLWRGPSHGLKNGVQILHTVTCSACMHAHANIPRPFVKD